LWGGRFAGRPDEFFARWQSSLAVDRRLWREDLAGSLAWARALARAGVLEPREARRIAAALERLGAELARDPRRLAESKAEDVHSFVEAELGRRVGALAKKLHAGRSRNDQVATDLRLWLKGALSDLDRAAAELQRALVEQAGRHAGLALAGYTHVQRAQPITVGHHALAYVEMLARDRGRLADARRRADECPLGSGALAGSGFPIDRAALAAELGFRGGPTRNSLDATASRDAASEAAFAAAQLMLHLSRLAEDWILFASSEFGFLELDDAVCTGSSLMPQKKNPDALELVRGQCARALGALQGLMALQKGLPLGYDRDLQEDKRLVFDALDVARDACLVVATAARGARWRAERCRAEAARGFQNATDLADLLVRARVPFRAAHERAGRAVRRALELGCELEALPAPELARMFPELRGRELGRELALERCLARRGLIGGTSPRRVRAEVARWRRALGPPRPRTRT
jgi:argininosuccinate lyase